MTSKVPIHVLASFFRQFATVVSSGLSLVRGISSLRERTRDVRLQRVLAHAERHIQGGGQLHACFSQYPEVFPPLLLALVRAGELSGKLDIQLRRAADLLERLHSFRKKIQSELLYPKILLFSAVVIPLAGQGIINGGGYVIKRLFLYGVAAGLMFIFYRFFQHSYMTSPEFRYSMDEIKLRIPYIRDFNMKYNFLNFSESFACLYEAGVSVPEAFEVALQSMTNACIQTKLLKILPRLIKGEGLTENFVRVEEIPPLVIDMISVGEQAGKLDEALKKVVEYYEAEVQHTLKNTATLAQPVAMIIMGLIIGYIVISGYARYLGQIDAIMQGR